MSKNISASSIYQQHIEIYIDQGQGYDSIHNYLLQDLLKPQNNQQNHFLSIRDKIKAGLLSQNLPRVQRSVEILYDLVENAGQLVSPIVNEQNFCFALYCIASTKKIVTLQWKRWQELRLKICQLFMYWFAKYQNQANKYNYLINTYRTLKSTKVQLPSSTNLTQKWLENKPSKINIPKPFQQSNNITYNELDINQIDKFITDTQKSSQNNQQIIFQTNFVRKLKLESKILYDISIKQANKLKDNQKKIVSGLYKRIRNILKKIDQINQIKQCQIKLKQQQKYSGQKLFQISRKKSQLQQKSINPSVQQDLLTKQLPQKTPTKLKENIKIIIKFNNKQAGKFLFKIMIFLILLPQQKINKAAKIGIYQIYQLNSIHIKNNNQSIKMNFKILVVNNLLNIKNRINRIQQHQLIKNLTKFYDFIQTQLIYNSKSQKEHHMITSSNFFQKTFLIKQINTDKKDNLDLISPWNQSFNYLKLKNQSSTIDYICLSQRTSKLTIDKIKQKPLKQLSIRIPQIHKNNFKKQFLAPLTPVPLAKNQSMSMQLQKKKQKISSEKSIQFPKLDVRQFLLMRNKKKDQDNQSMMVNRKYRKKYIQEVNSSRYSKKTARFIKEDFFIRQKQTMLIKKPIFGVIGLPTTKLNQLQVS